MGIAPMLTRKEPEHRRPCHHLPIDPGRNIAEFGCFDGDKRPRFASDLLGEFIALLVRDRRRVDLVS